MTTTTSYGSWNKWTGHGTTTLHASVEIALAGWGVAPTVVDDAAAKYREAINAALPDSVSLCGDEFYGPYYDKDCDFAGYPVTGDGHLDIEAVICSVDFWSIVDGEPVTDIDIVNPDDQTVSCIECPRADAAYLMTNHGRYWLCPDCDSDRLRDGDEK